MKQLFSRLAIAWSLGSMAKAVATAVSLTAIAAVVSPLSAYSAQLVRWRFDPQTRQLEIVTPGGTQPNYFILAQPPRIVVDLPETRVGQVLAEQTYSGTVRQIRVNQFQPTLTRVVIELEPEAELAAQQVELRSLDSQDGRWVIRPLLVGDVPAPAQPPATVGGWTDDVANVAIAQEPAQGSLQPSDGLERDSLAGEEGQIALEPDSNEQADEPETAADTAAAPDSVPPLEAGASEIAVDLEVIPAETAASEDERLVSEDESEPEGLEVASSEPATALSDAPAEENATPAEPEDEELGDPEAAGPGAASLGSPDLEAASLDVLDSVVPPDRSSASPAESGDRSRDTQSEVQSDAPEAQSGAQSDAQGEAQSEIQSDAPEIEREASRDEEAPLAVRPAVAPEAEPLEAEPLDTPQVEFTEAEPAEISRTEPADAPEAAPITAPRVDRRPPPAPSEERLDSAIALRIDAPTSILLPAGTVLRLRYPRASALELAAGESRQEILLTTQVVQDQQGEVVLPAGAQIIGRFESDDGEGRFVAQALVSIDGNRPLIGVSELDLDRRRLAVEPNQTLELQLEADLLKE